VSARAFDRWRLTLPLAIPSIGGLIYLYAFDAPARLLLINAGALVAALAWIMLGRLPASRAARLSLAAAGVMALFLPLLTGPVVGGVMRWLPAGPVMLQSGPLLLPLLTVLAARDANAGPILFGLAVLALGLQPDAGSLTGLAAAAATLACAQRSKLFALVSGTSVTLALATFGDGTLEPQVYTEAVLAQVAGHSPLQAVALGLLLFVAAPWFLATSSPNQRDEGYALAALLVGSGAMATLAAFPYPLIGYGASAILGFGLALGATAHRAPSEAAAQNC
jgi:hypothetical protein